MPRPAQLDNRIRDGIETGINRGEYPGAVFGYGNLGTHETASAGFTDLTHTAVPDPRDTIYDLASVTKVLATTNLILLLTSRKEIDLEGKAVDYLPDFTGSGKDSIRIWHLLSHQSGLRPFRQDFLEVVDSATILNSILQDSLVHPVGEYQEYSCLNFIILARIIEKIVGKSLAEAFQECIASPLNLRSCLFCPTPELYGRIAPTEEIAPWRDQWRERFSPATIAATRTVNGLNTICGEVHDETSACLHGQGGNAGLFASGEDVAALGKLALQGVKEGNALAPKELWQLFTARNPKYGQRGLGWDLKSQEGSSAGQLSSRNTFGHLGYTGTSLWIDPANDLYWFLLSNRVHPSRNGPPLESRVAYSEAVCALAKAPGLR